MEEGDVYVDPWQEYKSISARLKKRFLRKPNLAEASRSFERLSRRLQDQEASFHYAGLCKLGVARCEHSAGNVPGETGGLVAAGQLFVKAEHAKTDLSLPTYEENLNIAIHCYGHAIRVHSEQNELELASALCLELGVHLASFEKFSEAMTYFSKSAEHFRKLPLCRIYALKWVTLCNVKCDRYLCALKNLESIDDVAQVIVANQSPMGYYRRLLRDNDVLYLLCALQLRLVEKDGAASKHISDERWRRTVELFTKTSASPSRSVPCPEQAAHEPFHMPPQSAVEPVLPAAKDLASQSRLHPYMPEDLCLHLQSFALAILQNAWQEADEMLTYAWPYLEPIHQEIAMDLVLRSMQRPGIVS